MPEVTQDPQQSPNPDTSSIREYLQFLFKHGKRNPQPPTQADDDFVRGQPPVKATVTN